MSNFSCEKCGAECIDSHRGYITGCEHYPPDWCKCGAGWEENSTVFGCWSCGGELPDFKPHKIPNRCQEPGMNDNELPGMAISRWMYGFNCSGRIVPHVPMPQDCDPQDTCAQRGIIIGIDPGKKTGVAIYDRQTKQIVNASISDFWSVYEWLRSVRDDGKIQAVVIEVPRTKHNWHASKHGTTSANVGGIYREAHLLADGIERLGFKVHRVHPPGKKSADQVKRITGYEGRTNEHTRDAIMLAWGA